MDPPFQGFVLDPSKCSKLSMEEKRELVRELSKWPGTAPEKLQTWTRRELLEIICAEIGKERKYTGMKKERMIENLFRIILKKKSKEKLEDKIDSSPDELPKQSPQPPSKRQRKNDNPSRVLPPSNSIPVTDNSEDDCNVRYCTNVACRAALTHQDTFCKRCSCCICHKYDDNKDPSLWLFCSAENSPESPPGNPCGLSCHIECALKHEKAGIEKNAKYASLDGCYYCTFCGKVNDLLGCWKKQLIIAKDARRVDVLCYRISLSHKLLQSTVKYRSLHEIVDTALKKLEAEGGSIIDFSNLGRGIVNRLSVGAEVQRLCACAIELLDTQHLNRTSSSSGFVRFEDVSSASLSLVLKLEDAKALSREIIGFALWHRKSSDSEYPKESTCTILNPVKKIEITKLDPSTRYIVKVVALGNAREIAEWEADVITKSKFTDQSTSSVPDATATLKPQCPSPKANSSGSGLSNPSEGDESNTNSIACTDLNKSPECSFDDCEKPAVLDLEKALDIVQNDEILETAGGDEVADLMKMDKGLTSTVRAGSHKDSNNSTENNLAPECNVQNPDQTFPATPCRHENANSKAGRDLTDHVPMMPNGDPGSSSKKRTGNGLSGEMRIQDDSSKGTYEYCVKVVRWLECGGHIGTNFRVKFLTWFSLRATTQERRIVSVYVDTLRDDPASLAGQLVDTFGETLSSKRPPPMPTGLCMNLWH